MNGNLKLAWQQIKRSKLRSLFTMLGIIVAVTSVLVIISLGEGAKQDIRDQAREHGGDLLVIRPGGPQSSLAAGLFGGISGVFTDTDVEAITNTPDVQTVVPLSSVSGVVSYDGREYQGSGVIATSHAFAELLNHKTEFGEFLQAADEGRKFAVIGKQAAEEIFQENVPIGKGLEFRGERYVVKGVLAEFDVSPLTPGADYNRAIFIPYTTGKAAAEGAAQIFQILAKPTHPDKTSEAKHNISENLRQANGGQENFTVLKQDETQALTDQTLGIMTRLVAAIATISLLLGGIGVMNVMIVSVTERTKEIGIRKAVGATDQQILSQFLGESVILSAVGGVLGVIIAYLAVFYMRLFTSLQPVLPPLFGVLAILVALLVGVVFGVAPAVKAARKDPITALRRE